MVTYAYLRVSTTVQDVANQKLSVLEYCARHAIAPVTIVEDTSSGNTPWQARRIGHILAEAQAGDVLVVAEVSRLARSALHVLTLLQCAIEKGISVHVAKTPLVFDGSLQATIAATILGLAAHIEREFISVRTKEALARRKVQGLPLGRPRGPAPRVKLDQQADAILTYLKKGVSKRSIARIVDCAPSTLYAWLKRRKISAHGNTSPKERRACPLRTC
jgi:DNA invertase Pin-like site-specific DNA recombinase